MHKHKQICNYHVAVVGESEMLPQARYRDVEINRIVPNTN